MKNYIKNLSDMTKGALLAGVLVGAVVAVKVLADTAPFSFAVSAATVNATATNSAGAVSNITTANIQICPVHGAPVSSSQSSPQPVAIWVTCQGGAAPFSTNTYTFANSYDGTTVVTTNLWTVTLIANGTNVASGYALVGNTNFLGAKGFGLVSVTYGGTNTMTNISVNVSYPY